MEKKKSYVDKYFFEGQHLDKSAEVLVPDNADFFERILIKYRKYLAFFIPFLLMQTLWWITAWRFEWFALYSTHWQMPIIMILGATVAGMTSEGGGAIAFPFMTLALHLDPLIARDFSLLIQSVGMSCALFVILFMKIQIEYHTIIFGCVGSIPGLIIGFVYLDGILSPVVKKMLFVSIWSSFAVSLFMLNMHKKRHTYSTIPKFTMWKAIVLIATGFFGGILTSFAGSGVDICLFSIITLLFRVSEKTATPTTVVLIGLNSLVGVYYRAIFIGDVSVLAWNYLKVTAPISITFAPLGSFLGSHFHRQVLASLIYILESLSIIGFLITFPPIHIVFIGIGIIFLAYVFFLVISKTGEKLMMSIEKSNNLIALQEGNVIKNAVKHNAHLNEDETSQLMKP